MIDKSACDRKSRIKDTESDLPEQERAKGILVTPERTAAVRRSKQLGRCLACLFRVTFASKRFKYAFDDDRSIPRVQLSRDEGCDPVTGLCEGLAGIGFLGKDNFDAWAAGSS